MMDQEEPKRFKMVIRALVSWGIVQGAREAQVFRKNFKAVALWAIRL